jgi:hypothetical protein
MLQKGSLYVSGVLLITFIFTSILAALVVKDIGHSVTANPLINDALVWQTRTNGVVAISPELVKPFKVALAEKRILDSEINLMIFGASTVFGVRDRHFDESYNAFNYSSTSNALSSSLGEAELFIRTNQNLKTVIIPIDYVLGMPFWKLGVPQLKRGNTEVKMTNFQVLREAFSTERLKMTALGLFRQISDSNKEYLCPNGSEIGKDFGSPRKPGVCGGYRQDGSNTLFFAGMSKAKWLGSKTTEGVAKYVNWISSDPRQVYREYLDVLLNIRDSLKKRGGDLVVMYPPLAPGVEVALLNSPAKQNIVNLKSDLKDWAIANDIYLVDLSRAENFGCLYSEFYDAHHALETCYEKIIRSLKI